MCGLDSHSLLSIRFGLVPGPVLGAGAMGPDQHPFYPQGAQGQEQEGGPREDLQQDVNITCENWAQGWTQQKDRLTLCGEDHIWVSQRRRFCRVTYWDQGMSMPM